MPSASPPSRLRRGVRRLAITLCAVILGAGFAPSAIEPARPPAVVVVDDGAPAIETSTVDEPAAGPAPAPVLSAARPLLGRPVGAVAGRAPPAHLA